MPTPDKIDQLYDALKADGAVSKSRENFRSYMLASGEQGYRNRKQLYDALKADGAVESATYEEFRDRLGLHAVKPQQPVAKPSSTPRSAQQPSKPQKAKQQPKKTAWKPTPAQQLQFQQTINSVQQTIQNVNERHKNMAEYSKQRMKHPFGQRGGLAFGLKNKGALTPFDSKNLVQGRDEYNPKTGKFEPTYITAAGNKYSSRLIANSEQRQIDDAMERELHPIETQLRDAYAERDRLNQLAQERVDELEREYEERPWYTKLGEYANSDKMPDAGSPMLRWDNDVQYKQYMAALRKNNALITTLEDKKSGRMNEFWHTLGNEITNGYTFSLAGKAQLDDMAALTFAQKHVDAINKKRQKGEALTKEEQAAEAVLKNAEWDNRVQSQYGDEYGAWARAGKMGAVSLDLMVDFALMGGQPLSLAKTIAGGTGKLATKLVGKAATKGFGKYMVKATGATLGSMVAGAEIANTIGIGRTMSDAAGRYQGDVILDENGDYVFGHFEDDGKGGQKLVKGGDSFIGAVLGAERTAIAENGSEIAGAFLPGGKILLKGMEKIGLSKIASGLTSLSGRQWYAAYSRALQTAGFNGVPGEALEEYVGTGFDALMGGEEWKNLADKRTHVDIWLGCATMGALLNAPRIVGTGYQMAQYYRYKHNTDKSDRLAEIRLGNEAWEPLRQQIDEATNGQITDVLVNVLDNENLNEEQRKAVAEYAVNLQRMRGYSLGRVSSEERDDEHQPTQRELDEQTLEQSYTQGYGATDIADMQDIKHGMDYQHERVASFADANLMSLLDGSPMDAIDAIRSNEQLSDEQKQIAIDYVKARNTHNALLQRINDDADSLAEEDREQSKQMQHTDGSFHTAILKEKDGEGNDLQVYIVDGNVQMMPDGSMVDKAASDNIVVVYNPATGERKQIDPTADTGISSLGEVITAEEYDAGIEQKRQEYVKTMMDDVNGIIHPEVGQQVVYNGEPVTVTGLFDDGGIVASREDGTVITASHEELQQEADEISYADYLQRNGNEVEQADTNTSIPVTDTQKTVINGAPTEYNEGMELTIRDEDGTEKPAMVMGRVRYENGSFIPDANGSIVEYESNGETLHDHITALGDKVVSHTEERTVPTEMPQYSLDDDVYLQTEDGEIHGNVIAEENPDGLITIQSEQPIGGRIVNQFTREQLDGMTGNNAVENIPPQVNIGGENIPQEPVEAIVTPAEAPAQPTEQPTAEPMPVREDGEEDWQATTPERAHAYIFNEAGLSRSEGNEFIAAQTQAAQSALVKAKSAQMPRVGTSIKKYNEAKAKRQEKIDEAQRVLDYWQQVRNIQNDIQRVENERRAAEDAVRHDEAVAEAQAEYEARKQAEAERKAVGNENPMPAITEKWNNATKVDGHRDEIMLPDGTPLKGHYVLHESGASSPSHNPETWQKTDGFPMDANDNSVNDRDYERDHDAQEHTQSIARQYDQRALQSVPVVSNDGVVLSGNGRTMAGELAARDNTDGAYVNYLKEYAPKFGFTPEQVEAMQHPRVSFVPDEAMPYTAETFAKFNQQEMKSQNKTEQAVKLGKTVNDDSFKGIVRTINGYDTLGDFYNDAEASLGAVYDLHNAGVVPQAQLAEMVDGVRGQEKLSAVGREFLENMLIGKAFEGDPEVVRMLTAEPAMRQTVITALGEIVDNIALGGDWSLQGELADAVKLCFDARQGGAKYGEIVSTYARQGVLFADPDELQTVADFNNATMLMLADVLNDKRVTLLKTTLQLYNNNARQSAVGQADLFAGGIQSREDILRDVITFINENYGKRKEIEAARAEAVERRKAESVQQDGTPPAVSTDGEATAEPSAEPVPVEAEPVEATEPVEAEPNAVQTALAAAEQETNTEPTEAQKEAGNYKKGHVKIDGYDVTIENPKGSVRRGTDASGKQWEQEMQNTYGYIRGTEGVDGDHIDVFFSEDPSQGDVFVVDQVNKDGSFDEHKVMYGFPDIESARKAYLSNYEDGWQGLGAITPVSKEEFKKWIDSSHRKTKPFAEYSSVKPLGDTQLGEQPTAGYSIEPTTYTNKKGKTTPMHLVTFGRELSKDEIRAGKELAKESRGWWDREKSGFMMRDEDSAKALAEALSNEEAVQDAQPLSVEDVATVTDQADMKAVDETIKVEQEPQTTPQYDYDREDDVYDKTLTGLRNVLNDRKRGAIPNIKSIENVIRDLRKRAKTIEDGMATAAGETIPQAFDALANLNGRRKAYEQFLVDIRKKMAETERDDALAAHGVKLGDKIMYKGKEATIHDADARQVTLDTGMAPVLYEVTDWENVELPKPVKEYHGGDRVFSVKHNANKDIFVAHHKDGTVEYTFTDGTKANADEVQEALPEPKKVNVESLMGELNEKGEAKLSDHIEEPQQEESTEQPKQEEKKAKSKWVDDADAERFEELRRRLRQKLGGQLNMGVDPEAFALGVEMSYLMLKHGARKFAEFAKQMIEALGENVRPYLKSFYNGARDLPEMAEYEKELTPYDEVRTFDVMNFDKEGAKDIVATAEHIVREQAAEREAKEATDKLKQERNEQRKETEQEVAANTEALASEAATVASEVESKLPSARSEREVNDLAKSIDNAIDKVNDQLALLGYYEAEPVESDFNEAYGYMRNAEKKAVKNVTELFKTLTKELGISDPVVYDTKGKKQKSVTANIAPAGGDVTMRFMLNRDKGVELYIDFMLEPDYENNRDNLVLKGIMFRPEKNLPNGGRDYLRANNFFPVDVTVPQMLHGIRSVCQEWLPAEDYVAMAQRIAAENAGNQKEKASKGSKSKKKSVSLQEQTIPDLFSGLFSEEDNLKNESNDTARTRQAENRGREDGTVGRVPADRDRVLDTNGTEQTDYGRTASVSDTSGSVVDATRTGIPGQRSSRSATRGNNVAGETERGLSDGGRSLRNGETSSERRTDDRGTSAETGSIPSRAGEAEGGGKRGLAQLRGRGNVKQPKKPEPKFKRNYLYPENSSEIDNMTPQQRLTANVEALEVVRALMKEGREATPEEREILGKYRGWGGVELGRAYSTDMMRRSFTDRWGTPTEQGKLLSRLADVIDELDPNGERGLLSAINRAALTSYYTPTGIARAMNRFAELAGFKGGTMLDPSMGNGVFEGTMSKGVQQRTMIHGIELDWLTGQIARNLYPDANVLVTGYEQAGTADNAYDVVMSNIPFGSISVTDKTWKHDSSPVRKAAQGKIHNYFAVKMLDNTRPGGLCVIMTSNAILDTKGNQIIREHLADQAEVLGVVRLPDNTFKGAGTSVVTDVIFLRKYKDDADRAAIRGNEDYTANIEKPFLSSGELQLTNPTDGKTYKVTVNGYFTKNKGMMIGDAKAGGQYRADEFGLGSNMSTDELAAAMQKLVEKKIVGDRKGRLFDTHKTVREVKQAVSEAYKGDGSYISSGNIVEQDGMFGIVTSTKNKYGDVTSTFTEMPALKAKASRIRAMLPIRATMKELIAGEIGGAKESVLSELRQRLQKSYDDFVKQYGRLNDKANDFLTEDIDGYQLRALERYDDDKFVGLSDIFTKNTIKPALDLSTAKTPADAISLSLAEYGEINPSFMEDVLGESWAEQCGETLFRTPFTEDVYETADAYLSGDVKTKLEQAREAAKQDKTFEHNVKALEAVQPEDIPFEDISIRMGARWIPAEVYTDFMYDMFGIRKNDWKGNKSGVEYMPEVDQYVVNVANNELGGEADAWRTSRRAASEVFTAALQDKSLSVYDTIKENGKEIKVLNKEETELLNNKIQDLRTAFEDWLSQNPEREEMLMRLYNDKFNRTVLRKFDGSHLNVAGLMGKELRPHQKDAVWMLINNRGGIVDHIVGAGKTLVMQSAIMEMRRMGIAKKPMIIGLKATVAQIAKEFREAYPAARILAPTEKDFEKKNRKKLLAKIAVNDYDCIIISHDNYTKLDHTEEVERGVIDEQMAQLDAAIEFLYGQSDKNQLTKKQIKGLEKRKANLEAKLASLLDRKIDREFTFEGLGVDYLFVDECQHFKSLPYVSTYDRVAGLGDKKGSQRAIALLNGVRYLQKMHQGDRGTVFLSGTTISNSLSEIYHLLNYLRPSEMEKLGMTTFDAWAGNYAIHTAELEYGVTNELKEKDRFRSLTNIPELSKMYAEIADVRNDMNLKLPKPKMRSHVVTVPQSDIMQEINREIVNMVKNKDGSYFGIDSKDTTPWGLLASTLSAKAAINPRLIDEAYDSEGGKIPAVCENVKKIYDQFAEQKGTQLIFCDTGVPGKGKKYDAYSDIINRLVNDYGIPRKEIADIHEANTDEKRKALFAKVNDGSVRILIGGTKNMGTGVNVQKRIVAMHHVDVPWTPADREQREGRGVRQGNEIARDFNDDNVDVYFYATEGSLDMYKYQLQETKGKLFAQFKSGTIGDRTFDEGDAEGDFDPAEVVAMLSGNPVIFEKSKQDKKVEKLRRAKRAYESDWQRRRSRYEELQQKKRNFERLLSLNASDVRDLERGGFTPDEEGKYPTTVTVSVKDDYSSRRTFDKPKEAGEYIHSLLKQGKKVQLTGFNQKANITVPITDAGLFGKPVAELDSYGGIKYTVEVSDDDTAAGVAFRNLLQKVYSNRKVYERNLEDVNNQLKGADPGENKFPKQAELDEALKEKKRLDDEYKKLSDEEPKADENKDGGLRFRDDDARDVAQSMDDNNGTEVVRFIDFLRRGRLEQGESRYFHVGETGDILNEHGISGKITIGTSAVNSHHNEDADHLDENDWVEVIEKLNEPVAITEYGDRGNSYRIYTIVEKNGKNICVGVDVNSVGRDVNITNIRTAFARDIANALNERLVYPHSRTELETAIRELSLRHNREVYPEQPYDAANIRNNSETQSQNGENLLLGRDGLDKLPQQSRRVYTTKERREHEAYAERQWRRAHEVANEIIDKLNISDDITVYESIDEVPGSEDFSAKRRRSKGWYDPRTNKIVVVLGNHRSPNDVLQTILHEAVAHYGLRKLFGKNFETFLDNVYKYADMDVRRRIINMAANKGWDIREATEEYLASLAEDTDFDNAENRSWAGHWFNKIKQLFLDMLHHIGLRDYDGVSLSDNELRYILWRSYKNLAEPGHYRNYFSIAEDTVMQSNMHVGDFAEETGETIEQTTKVAESGLMFRDGDFTPRDRAIARDTYERMVSTGGYQFQEAVQDSMLGLKRLYQSILGKGTRMEDVDGFENAYLAENRMSSVNAAEQHEYYVRFMKPLLKAISDIAGANNGKRQELTDYMMAKHGLERNVVMAQRDFDAYQQQYPKGTKTLDDFRERDYAGLTALTGEDDVAMAELTAQQMVDNYEQDNDTTELWKRVNDATAATLAKIYSSGLLSKERYEQIQKMFEYYIPLQGWDETTSDEVYGYLTSKNGPLGGSPIKHAKGRSSKADDPIATIALMADDAIRQGNRNKMKQTFLNFVLNHQSDLVSVNDLWLQYNAAMDEWEPVFADIENSDTAADVERKVEAFEERMQQLAESDPDNYKRGRDAQNIPYIVVKDNLKEHQVLVRRNGRTYVLTINGNPRAAQALNGLTNPDVETGGVVGNLMQGAQWLNRNLSAFYTTRNPDFVVSNFFRDMLYSNCMTWVKESPKYALRFHKNFGRVNPARMRILLGKWEDGTLDESNYIENLFKQFMLNGGETGYTNIKDIDGHKREIAAELKRNGSNARKAWQWLGEQLDLLNSSAENCARFAAFVTSREDGRSIERSIYDAKEISVNFNKKGSGGKMVNATGQTLFGKVGSYVGGGGRLLYVFWNAGVQGTTNFARAAKRNPIKATVGAASMFMLGAVIPFLAQAMGGDDDDDKNAYYNLPEYVRRSNIIINAGNQWIAIPLPIEFRAFYGLGELATGVITGNERYSDSELAFQMGSQISQILPLDMLEGGGGINPFIPSSAKPFVEAYMMNKSWTGLPVYKDSPWNKNNPEWTKAYKSANSYLVSGAKWLNEISGGDDYKKGFIDINPAKVEYLLSGIFGGAFTTGDKLMKMGETIFSDREFDWRNMLIANRVVKTGDERTANRKLSNEYFKYKDEYEETKRLLKKYSDEAATNERYKHRLERLQQSEEYLLYDVFDNYQPILKNLHDAKDGADETTLKSIESEENTLRRDMVDLMHAIEDGMKPDINAHVDAMLKREFEAGGRTQKPAGSRIAKRLGGTDSYGSPQNEYGQVYLQMRDYVDLAEDVTLQTALKNAKERGDTDRVKDIESARSQITEVKKDLADAPYNLEDGTKVTAEDIMQELRDLRKSLMSELGITTQQHPNR